MPHSDNGLVQRTQSGDTAAFAKLVAGHQKAVYGIALSATEDAEEAEDLVQASFVSAFTRIGELRDGRRFGAWLYAIARNKCRDWLHDRPRRPALLSDTSGLTELGGTDPALDPEMEALAGISRGEVRTAVRGLPAEYRAVVVLRYVAELTYDEIAEALSITPVTARVRCHRARAMLEQRLNEVRAPEAREGAR